jgi:hypothetical protein
MFKVTNTVPGFRVGIPDEEPAFRMRGFDPPGGTYGAQSLMGLLTANPYLRAANNPRGIGSWETPGVAPASPIGWEATPSTLAAHAPSAWVLPHPMASGLQFPAPVDTNVVPVGSPPTPCVGGLCEEGGSYGNGGVIPHPILPRQYLCPECALKLFDLDIRDPEVRKMLER